VTAVHERLHEQHAVIVRRRGHGRRLGAVQRKRFFAEDVLARPRRANGPFGMKGVRQTNINRLHLAIREQRLVGAVRPRHAEFAGETIGRRLRPAADGRQLTALRCENAA